MDGEDISCVAVLPGVDPLEERDLRKSAKFELGEGGSSSRGGSTSGRSSSGIQLLDASGDELTICAKSKRSGQSLTFEIEFESDPEPESVRESERMLQMVVQP